VRGCLSACGTVSARANTGRAEQYIRISRLTSIFSAQIIFSQAAWIGSREENPSEMPLELPKSLEEDEAASDDVKYFGSGIGVSRHADAEEADAKGRKRQQNSGECGQSEANFQSDVSLEETDAPGNVRAVPRRRCVAW
jgi:hypothetical protein